MNPPFFYSEEQFEHHKKFMGFIEKKLKHQEIILDLDFEMHDNFIDNFEKHLTDNGRIALEDIRFVPKEMFLEKYGDRTNINQNIKSITDFPEYFNEKGNG